MDKGWIPVLVIAVIVISSGYFLSTAESAVAPTRAFSSILTDAGRIVANSYNSQLIAPRMPYAQISDLTTQSCAADGAASNVTLNTNDSIHKITHSTSTKTHEIKIQETGTYQIISVPQIGEATVQADGIHNFWMMKNNAQVPNTNVKTSVMLQLVSADTMTATLNWVGRLSQNDIVYFQQACTDADIGIIFTSGAIPPNTPSVIISIAKLNW